MPDLKTNMSYGAGLIKCHSTLDLEITPWGDIALTDSDEELFEQRFLLYWGTPQGERINPAYGCPWFDFQHERSTPQNLQLLEKKLYNSLRENFPELTLWSVKLSYLDNARLYGEIYVGASKKIPFIVNSNEDLMELASNVHRLTSIAQV